MATALDILTGNDPLRKRRLLELIQRQPPMQARRAAVPLPSPTEHHGPIPHDPSPGGPRPLSPIGAHGGGGLSDTPPHHQHITPAPTTSSTPSPGISDFGQSGGGHPSGGGAPAPYYP